MKILFVLPRMVSGGIEGVRLKLIREFIAAGHECRLALRRAYGELLEQAEHLVPITQLAPHGLQSFVPNLVRLLQRERPTHVLSAFPDVGALTFLALRQIQYAPKWIHSVHNTHSWSGSRPGWLGHARYFLENRMAGYVYRHADAIVTVSEGLFREVVGDFHIAPDKVKVVYNPVVRDQDLLFRRAPMPRGPDHCWKLLSVGRLAHQKAYDVLINAMCHVGGRWELDIWGDGPERERLQALIVSAGLRERIQLRGYTSDPASKMREADIFVLPSRHEGFGNVLVEAMASQCQLVAADCEHGPSEILRGGQFGQLVPTQNPLLLAHAITRSMSGEIYFAPDNLRERARDFTVAASSQRWLGVLQRP